MYLHGRALQMASNAGGATFGPRATSGPQIFLALTLLTKMRPARFKKKQNETHECSAPPYVVYSKFGGTPDTSFKYHLNISHQISPKEFFLDD